MYKILLEDLFPNAYLKEINPFLFIGYALSNQDNEQSI